MRPYTTPTVPVETTALNPVQSGVCYHCRGMIWNGESYAWNAPPTCPHCQRPLILALIAAEHDLDNRQAKH